MHPRIVRCLFHQADKYAFSHALGSLTIKHALASKTVAFNSPEAIGHKLVCSAIVCFRLVKITRLLQLNGEPRLDAISMPFFCS